MIAEETTAERLDELRHVLRTSLLKTGIMGTLRAQLRSSAIDILKGNDGNGLKEILDTHELPEEGTPEHFATLLVFDFLNHFSSLNRSSGIFAEESGLSLSRENFGAHEAKGVSKELKMENEFSPQQYQNEPLLVTAVKKMMSGGVNGLAQNHQHQAINTASSSAIPSARQSPAPAPKSPIQNKNFQEEDITATTPSTSVAPSTTFFSDLMKTSATAENDDPVIQKVKQSMPKITDKKFRSKEFKDVVVDGNKLVNNSSSSNEIGDWDDVENVDKEFVSTKKELATSSDVNIIIAASSSTASANTTHQEVKNSTSSSLPQKLPTTTITSSSAPLPVFGQLPPLTHHAKTLAPLDNNSSSLLSTSSVKNNNINISSSLPAAPTPVSYEDDFDEEEDDDTF